MLKLAVLTVLLVGGIVGETQAASVTDGITVHRATCPVVSQVTSCAAGDEVWLLPRDGEEILWHETGHVVDGRMLDKDSRAWFTRMFGYPAGTPWFAGWQVRAPGELFAEAFARCHLGWKPVREKVVRRRRRGGIQVVTVVSPSSEPTGYDYSPTVHQHRQICNGIAVLELLYEAGHRS